MAKKMATVTRDGDRLEMLKNLAAVLAKQIDDCAKAGGKCAVAIPTLSKQYRDTLKEIAEIEGVDNDDEIAAILSERSAAGKPGAVRKNLS